MLGKYAEDVWTDMSWREFRGWIEFQRIGEDPDDRRAAVIAITNGAEKKEVETMLPNAFPKPLLSVTAAPDLPDDIDPDKVY